MGKQSARTTLAGREAAVAASLRAAEQRAQAEAAQATDDQDDTAED